MLIRLGIAAVVIFVIFGAYYAGSRRLWETKVSPIDAPTAMENLAIQKFGTEYCMERAEKELDKRMISYKTAEKRAIAVRELIDNCLKLNSIIRKTDYGNTNAPAATTQSTVSPPAVQPPPQPKVEGHGWYKLTDRNAWRIVFRPNAQNGIEYSLDLPELRNASRIRIYGREGHLETIKEPSLSVGPDGTGQNRCIVDENTGGTIPHTGISCGALLVNTGSGWQFAGEGFTLANTGGTLRVTANIHRSAPQDVKTISVFSFTVEPI